MPRSHDQMSDSLAPSSVGRVELAGPPEGVAAPPALQSGPDPLSDALRAVKLTGALFFLVDASCPWGVEVPHGDRIAPVILPCAQHIVSYHIVLKGAGFASIPGLAATRFAAGDILVFPHGDPYAMLSAPRQRPEYDVEASLAFFRDMAAGRLPFVVEEGGGGPDGAQFVCGFLGCDMRPFNPVLAALPRLLHVRRPEDSAGGLLDRLIELTLAEARSPRPGGACVRLRLSELLFVEVVRRYMETPAAAQSGWLAGVRDAGIGRALALLHRRPVHSWTLAELAREAGMSRAVLAERFTHLVGCPPMHYLTQWRMQTAARLLSDGASKVAAVGREVGYDSEAAFSRAFKKTTGLPPAEWRRRVRGVAEGGAGRPV